MASANELLRKIETARLWNYFHKDWLLPMRVVLRAQLPAGYRVFVESEAVLISPTAPETSATVLPDVSVGRGTAQVGSGASPNANAGTAAVVEAEEACTTETHYSLVIRRAPENYIVAVVELLSPSNKGLGNRLDREKHLRKRRQYLDAGISLLEIDSLLEGERDLPEPLAPLAADRRIAWAAFHEDSRRRYRGWGWNELEPLPTVEWRIDIGQAALIDLEMTLRAAVEFNDWEQLCG